MYHNAHCFSVRLEETVAAADRKGMAPGLGVWMMLWAATATVKPGGATLRNSCSPDAEPVAKLAAGSPVELKFSLNGDLGQCFKVAVGERSGYLLASELDGTSEYDRARADAPSLSSPQLIRAEMVRWRQEAAAGEASPSLSGVLQLLESNQPRQALELLETRVLPRERSYTFLALAGVAAFQGDDARRAVEYLTEALAMQPNPQLEELLARARRELKQDRSRDRAASRYFVLRYDGTSISAPLAAEMSEALDEEYQRISGLLGCRGAEKITAIVQGADAYYATTGAAVWSGGQFDGRIHVPLLYENNRVGPRMRRAFAHEIVHACIAQWGSFPSWFHEGLAQKLSGESLTHEQRAAVAEALREKRLPPIEKLDRTWSGLTGQAASLAYTCALAAVELLIEQYGIEQVRGLLRRPETVSTLAVELSRKLVAR